ncbi:MAG TPA: hypothetical protein VL443_23420 [Cyclobacteriaceae bacterium]|jgi:hypothetical protein|nr:hypothetical protein [Cyclobacteriaceae bacterium]
MIKTLTLSILLFWTIKALGQDSLRGSWTLRTYNVGDSKEAKIEGKRQRAKITFDGEGSYTKSYYVRELPDGARLQLTSNLMNGKTSEKYFDKDGNEIKVGHVKKQREEGRYERISLNQIRFSTDKQTYINTIRLQGLDLIVIDTIFKKALFLRYKRK